MSRRMMLVGHFGVSSCHPPRTIASAMRAARTFGSTSWTRTMSAPAAMPSAVVASVPSSADRRAGRAPCRWSTCGSSRAAPAGPSVLQGCEVAQHGQVLLRRFCRSRCPGRRSMFSQATPAASARSRARARSAITSRDDVRVARSLTVVHQDDGQCRCSPAKRSSASSAATPQMSLSRFAPASSAAFGHCRLASCRC